MPSSSPTRWASRPADSMQSAMVAPCIGTKGQTSVAPIRACSPWCLDMSISSAALRIARNAASSTTAGSPASVTTVRLVAAPGSTSSRTAPSVSEISLVMASITP